jgi:hypothetical protein
LGAHGSAQRAHDSGGDRMLVSHWVSYGNDKLTDLKMLCVAQVGYGIAVSVNLQNYSIKSRSLKHCKIDVS